MVWGGTAQLSPADDILIQVERPLDFDSDGQLVASVLSKKVAAGSTHLLVDMPVGPTAKVRSSAAANRLADRLLRVGETLVRYVLLCISPTTSNGPCAGRSSPSCSTITTGQAPIPQLLATVRQPDATFTLYAHPGSSPRLSAP